MRRFTTIFLAVLSVVLTAAIIVKSEQEWENNADDLMKTLTPEVLITHCGKPAADIALGSLIKNRQMFYPTSKDRSIGLIFTFVHTPSDPNWTYMSFHLGAPESKGLLETEDVKGSNSWALIELPCLDSKR